jgi:hypothetical protein
MDFHPGCAWRVEQGVHSCHAGGENIVVLRIPDHDCLCGVSAEPRQHWPVHCSRNGRRKVNDARHRIGKTVALGITEFTLLFVGTCAMAVNGTAGLAYPAGGRVGELPPLWRFIRSLALRAGGAVPGPGPGPGPGRA